MVFVIVSSDNGLTSSCTRSSKYNTLVGFSNPFARRPYSMSRRRRIVNEFGRGPDRAISIDGLGMSRTMHDSNEYAGDVLGRCLSHRAKVLGDGFVNIYRTSAWRPHCYFLHGYVTRVRQCASRPYGHVEQRRPAGSPSLADRLHRSLIHFPFTDDHRTISTSVLRRPSGQSVNGSHC